MLAFGLGTAVSLIKKKWASCHQNRFNLDIHIIESYFLAWSRKLKLMTWDLEPSKSQAPAVFSVVLDTESTWAADTYHCLFSTSRDLPAQRLHVANSAHSHFCRLQNTWSSTLSHPIGLCYGFWIAGLREFPRRQRLRLSDCHETGNIVPSRLMLSLSTGHRQGAFWGNKKGDSVEFWSGKTPPASTSHIWIGLVIGEKSTGNTMVFTL